MSYCIVKADRYCFPNSTVDSELERLWRGLPSSLVGTSVFVKPNLVMPVTKWECASTVHVAVISLLIRALKDLGCADITIGDCGFRGQWKHTIKSSGYDLLPAVYGIKLVGLEEGANAEKFSWLRFEDDEEYMSLFGAQFSDYMLEADFVISAAKLKVHKMAGITGCIKNMMGTMRNKGNMHPRGNVAVLHKRLRDLYLLLKDRVHFCLIDGIIGSEYSEHYGVPVKAGVLVSGDDPWELDCIAAQLMGMFSRSIPYLRLLKEKLRRDYPSLPTELAALVTPFEKPLKYFGMPLG